MPYVYVGRTHTFVGKRLWEIIGNLKDFGIGRMVVRSRNERYPEVSYYRIIKAEPKMDTGAPLMDEDNMKGKVIVEEVFRGKNMGVANISKAAYKTDFRLIPKHEEAKYLEQVKECKPTEERIYPQTMEMPPLLKMLAEREGHASNVLKVNLRHGKSNDARLARDGETPNVDISIGLGTPVSPQLYEGVL